MDSRQDCVLFASNEHDFFLLTSITKPIKAHVHSVGSALHNCVSDDIVGNNDVKLNWCWTLDVAHFI